MLPLIDNGMGNFPVILLMDVIAAAATHAWFRKNEPETLLRPFLALLIIPSPMAYLASDPRGWNAVANVYALFVVSLLASIIVYRLSPFHPLADYPGPVLCKISKIWPAYIAYHGRLHHYYKALHEIYGPIVRVGPNEISMIDKSSISGVLGALGMPKGPLWEGRRITPSQNVRDPLHNGLISARDFRRHAQLRKSWNKAFGNAPMKDYEDIMIERAGQLKVHLHQVIHSSASGQGHVDLAKWISFFSFDFMGDMAFGGGFELMRDGDTNGLWAGMEQALFVPSIAQHVPWLSRILRAMPLIGANIRKFGAFALKQATMRSKAHVQKRDLFYYLLAATDPESTSDPLPLIVSNAVLTIVAGSDTTSSVLSNIVYYLLRHPHYLQRLRCEVDNAFPSDEHTTIDTAKLTTMKTLNAIINETLRLQPPVMISLQRSPAKDSGGKLVGNTFIPEGTAVNVPPYVLHRHPQYFSPRPDDFWPERWLLAENDAEKRQNNIVLDQTAFIPFSTGPANCAGKSLAMLELRYITTMLIREFDIVFAAGYSADKWERDLEDRFVVKKGVLPVVLTARKSN